MRTAVVGVVMDGVEKSGALCGQHWSDAKKQDKEDRLSFFMVKRNSQPCTICQQAVPVRQIPCRADRLDAE